MTKTDHWRGFVIIAATLLLSIFSTWLSQFLWKWLDVPEDAHESFTMALTMAVILLGFLSTVHLMHATHSRDITKLIAEHSDEVNKLIARFPQYQGLEVYSNGEQGLQRLTQTIGDAIVGLNTMLLEGNNALQQTAIFEEWTKARMSAIGGGGLVFYDIMSRGQEKIAREWVNSPQSKKASYHAFCIDCNLKKFMNFIVLTYPNRPKEVWFGWIMSANLGYEQPCVRTTEKGIVTLFEKLHAALLDDASKIRVTPS